MVFSTWFFLFYFLPIVLVGYHLLGRFKSPAPRTIWLTLLSYIFYGWWRPDFLILMFVSTALDYICGNRIADPTSPNRKRWLLVSIIGNLGLLAYFKYANFGIETFNALLRSLGMEPFEAVEIVLPIGISFYTFQTMSYSIDIYRGHAKPAKSLIDMACYVALFPQLVAGPIVRYQDLADQLVEREHSLSKFGHGAMVFMIGFAKKILLANSAGEIVTEVFGTSTPGLLASWVGMLAYAMQIYFDFSGYSDMAIGLGRMFGFEFVENFASPYRSKSITEFWRRWHISLSTWLRDYLYIPLGGNRGSSLRTYINLLTTMLLGGLWHGAKWTFVVWGAWHGTLLALERAAGKSAPWKRLPTALQIGLTFILVLIGWVFFRAESMSQAIDLLAGMVGASGIHAAMDSIYRVPNSSLVLAGASLLLTWGGIQTDRFVQRGGYFRIAIIYLVFVFAICTMLFQTSNPFLYFQF